MIASASNGSDVSGVAYPAGPKLLLLPPLLLLPLLLPALPALHAPSQL
jgi:hypothetical protein